MNTNIQMKQEWKKKASAFFKKNFYCDHRSLELKVKREKKGFQFRIVKMPFLLCDVGIHSVLFGFFSLRPFTFFSCLLYSPSLVSVCLNFKLARRNLIFHSCRYYCFHEENDNKSNDDDEDDSSGREGNQVNKQ